MFILKNFLYCGLLTNVYFVTCRNIAWIFIRYNIDSYKIVLITIPISISYFFPVIPSTPDLSYPYMLLPISIPNH